MFKRYLDHDENDPEGVLELFISHFCLNMNTCLPARVESYDPVTQKADLQPLTSNHHYDPDADKLVPRRYPVLPCVPVVFPSSGDHSITWPVQRGDVMLVVFSQRSVDLWLTNGDKHNDPFTERPFDLSDGFAIPGSRSFNVNAPAQRAPIPAEGLSDEGMVIRTAKLAVRAEMVVGNEAKAQAPAMSPEVAAEFAKLWDALADHVHVCAPPGAPSGTAVVAGPAAITPTPSDPDTVGAFSSSPPDATDLAASTFKCE